MLVSFNEKILSIFTPAIHQFILDHEHDDERSLVLKQREILGVPSSVIADQIAGRRKAKEKLPTYYQTPGIIYPPGVNLEQSSSEQTARYKAELVFKNILRNKLGKEMADLTGGFGVDTLMLSKHFAHVHFVEPNKELLEISKHNHEILGATNITYHQTTAEQFLDQLNSRIDLIYIDPSRRTTDDKRVYTLADSEPDIVALHEKVMEKSNNLLIKTSPLLDISLGIDELTSVKTVHVVAVDNECKELLFQVKKSFRDETIIEAVNLRDGSSSGTLTFLISGEQKAGVEFRDPLTYIYEPNAAILKAGAFKSVAERYTVYKIHPSTHFYTSDRLIQAFPGRIFKIDAIIKPDPKEIAQWFPDSKANIVTRNYPLSVEELKKKTKLKDGGEKFLLAFAGLKEMFVCAATRV